LIQRGFIQRTQRGRVATPYAYEHLNKPLSSVRRSQITAEASKQLDLFQVKSEQAKATETNIP